MDVQATGPPSYIQNTEQIFLQNVHAQAVLVFSPWSPPNPPPAATPVFLPIHPPTSFELLIQVVQPTKCACKASKKTKAEEVKAYGPISLTADVGWCDFLATITKELSCCDKQLNILTSKWHWSKPANSSWIPVQTENGLFSLLNEIVKSPLTKYVLLHMHLPKPAVQSAWTHGVGGSHADEGEFSDHETGRKKVQFTAFYLGTGTCSLCSLDTFG